MYHLFIAILTPRRNKTVFNSPAVAALFANSSIYSSSPSSHGTGVGAIVGGVVGGVAPLTIFAAIVFFLRSRKQVRDSAQFESSLAEFSEESAAPPYTDHIAEAPEKRSPKGSQINVLHAQPHELAG